MPITRIKNNQITDATIVASSKLQDNSITAGKLANNINYGSNLTITGNLTVNGTSTTLDTVNTLIEDPILLLAKDQTGSAALDIGFVGERGDDTNIAWIWDESADQFAAGFTSDDGSANTITLSSYADVRANDVTVAGITVSGNVTGPLNVTGAIEASTTITAGTTVTATGNVSGGNITTGGAMEATGLISSGSTITATGNVAGGNITTGGAMEATGLISSGTTITATGNVAGGNLTTAGQVAADNADITNGITAGTTITATGNVSGGNITTGGAVEATGLISSGTTITATGNVAGGNITTGGAVEATGLISSGTTITATGNVAGGNLTTGGDIDASGDIAGLTITSATFQGSNPTIQSTGTDQNIILDPNGTGAVSVENAKITNLATPTADGDAATKAYVDSVAEGLDIKESCVAATTGALPAVTYDNGTGGVGATLTADANGALAAIDGVTLVADERVLVQNQAAQLQNGIYVVTTVGDAGTAFVLTRAGDFDGSPASEIPGGFTFVEEGTTNADSGFVCTTNAPVTVGTTAIVFTQFSGAGSIVAGDGLGKTGDTLSVNVDDVTTAIVSDEVVVKTSANLTTPNIGVANGDSFTASGTVSATGNITGGNLTTGGDVTTVTVTASGAIAGSTTITATGNVDGGNITTGGAVEATGLISSGTTITATGNVAGGNLTTAGQVAADNADITNGITAGTTVTATGNVAGGNITTGGAMEATGLISSGSTITATGNVAGGNITTGGRVDATGAVSGASLTAGNVTVNTDSIDSAGEAITLNTNSSDVDIIIENATGNAYVKADAGTSTVVVGENGTQTTGVTLKVESTDSQMVPVGTTAQRPTGVTGMIRFNTSIDAFEFYDSNSWTTAGSDFTVIATQTFNGDNSTVAFTLSESQTTASCIVSINGVVQLPTTAYAVSGTTLTFTEAPLAGDVVEVRKITTTTTITSLANSAGTAIVEAVDGAAQVKITGDLLPVSDGNLDLGSAALHWQEAHLGSTVFYDSDDSNTVTLSAPATVASNVAFTLPGADGSSGQALITDGSGTLSFGAAGATVTNDESTNADRLIYVGSVTSGALTAVTQDSGLTYNPSTGTLTSAEFVGGGVGLTDLDGSAITSGTVAAARVATLNQNTTGTAGGLSSAVTVSLTGPVTGSATFTSAGDTASIATTLTADPVITLTGAVTGSATMTNLGNVSIATTATSDPVITLTGDVTGSGTMTNLGNVSFATTIAANSVALGTDTTGNYVQQGATSGSGISGSVNSEGGTFTVTSNATNANTGSTIVFRDASGNFSAGVITATATQARYADLAEMYAADGDIEAGTVVHFAGEGKLAACDQANHHAVAGIISTDPAYLMNTDQEGVALAISGRVPCKVTGVVNAGDLMVSAGNGMAMANNSPAIGTVIGKAIESNAGGEAVIEVLAMMM